jgi:hypothetical protein
MPQHGILQITDVGQGNIRAKIYSTGCYGWINKQEGRKVKKAMEQKIE